MSLVLNNEELRAVILTGLQSQGWRIESIECIVDADNDLDEDLTSLQATIKIKEPKIVRYEDDH